MMAKVVSAHVDTSVMHNDAVVIVLVFQGEDGKDHDGSFWVTGASGEPVDNVVSALQESLGWDGDLNRVDTLVGRRCDITIITETVTFDRVVLGEMTQ